MERGGGERPGKSDDLGCGTFPRASVLEQRKTPIALGAVEAVPSKARAGRSPEAGTDPNVIGRRGGRLLRTASTLAGHLRRCAVAVLPARAVVEHRFYFTDPFMIHLLIRKADPFGNITPQQSVHVLHAAFF